MIRDEIFDIKISDNSCEFVYVNRIIDNIIRLSDFNKLKEFKFIITSEVNSIDVDENSEKTIVILTGDEYYRIPNYLNNVHFVFKNYVNNEQDNLFAIPLGYNQYQLDLPHKLFSERKIDVFFSGQVKTVNRINLMRTFNSSVLQNYNTFINRTKAFRQGLSPENYSNTMMDSKIALCPDGNISSETFRFFEAMRYGCVVVTTKKPKNYIYENIPAIVIDNWESSVEIIKDLLQDEDRMLNLSKESLQYWNDICSEKSVAKYIISKIKF